MSRPRCLLQIIANTVNHGWKSCFYDILSSHQYPVRKFKQEESGDAPGS